MAFEFEEVCEWDVVDLQEIKEKFNIPADHILYLGDTGVDMKTAVAAGMHPVGVLWGFRAESELSESGAKDLISRPEELLQIIY